MNFGDSAVPGTVLGLRGRKGKSALILQGQGKREKSANQSVPSGRLLGWQARFLCRAPPRQEGAGSFMEEEARQ